MSLLRIESSAAENSLPAGQKEDRETEKAFSEAE